MSLFFDFQIEAQLTLVILYQFCIPILCFFCLFEIVVNFISIGKKLFCDKITYFIYCFLFFFSFNLLSNIVSYLKKKKYLMKRVLFFKIMEIFLFNLK